MIILISIIFLFFLLRSFYNKNFYSNIPGPIEIPFIGSFILLGDKPHLTLTKWSKKYGKVFKVFMGDLHSVVISDPVIIREIWLKNFESFTDRPHFPSFSYLSGDYHDVSSANYIDWKQNRNIVANAFTRTKLKSVEPHINNQCRLLIKRMSEFEKSNQVFYPKNHLKKYALNIILLMVFNDEISYEEGVSGRFITELIEPIDRLFEYFGSGSPLDFFKIFDPLTMILVKRAVGKDYNKILNFINVVKQEHLKNLDPENPRDLFDHIISSNYADNIERNIQGIALDMLGAGTDTSSSTLFWFCLYMCNNPTIQEKAFNEIKINIGQDAKEVSLSDRINLPYTYAIIKEVLRIKPIAPLGVPRACVQDIEISDYKFHKGDQLFMNLYALHHDEQYWSEPERFLPERFVGNNHSEYWLPFSIGPRNCVGMNLAHDSTFLACANILLNFKMSSATGKQIDDSEIFGLTIHPNDFGIKLESR